jgi:cyclic-di-AMP phosphodiesterase PgpH
VGVTTASDKSKVTLVGRTRGRGRAGYQSFLRRCKESFLQSFRTDPPKWILLIFLSLITSAFLFPSILIRPVSYNIGDVAVRDIKASRDFLMENTELTDKDTEKAAREVLSVYDFDPSTAFMTKVLNEAFKLGREYVSKSLEKRESPAAASGDPAPPVMSLETFKEQFFETLKIPDDDKLFRILHKQGFASGIEEAVQRLLSACYEKGVVSNGALLRSHVERGGIILHEISAKRETQVSDYHQFLDLERARTLIRGQNTAIKESSGSAEFAEAAVRLASAHLQPNLTFNQRETERRKELARASVKPIYYKIKQGEMLVREGERIGPEHLIKLKEELKSQNRMDMLGRVSAMAVLIAALLSVIYLVGPSSIKSFSRSSRNLLFSALCVFGFFLLFWGYSFVADEMAKGFPNVTSRALLFAFPLPCAAMLVCIFQGTQIAAAFSLVISVLASLIAGGNVEFFVFFFTSSLLAAHGVRHCNERGILIKTGAIVAVFNILVSLSLVMIFGSLYTWEAVVSAISAFAGGILAGVIATGIIPLIEMSFGFTTDIKLLELSSLDQPLLRQLMVHAPGTYHHCVITSNMVEATAQAVQANPLLSKVSAYYHDIGKMKKPQYFIENQIGIENKHEKLAPSMSSLILISHVKDGVELAREYRLGKEIIDIIQQHHGRSLISYFYQKAKDRMSVKSGKSSDVKEEDFRYPGPKPQTKEAGLVMLADMVEAASRSLVDPTPARIQGMVQKVVNNVFTDGQLDECELTLKDLHEIAKSFNKTLSGIFHQRIEYPEVAAKNPKKARNGSTDHGAAEDAGGKKQEDKGETEEGLKRLGLS